MPDKKQLYRARVFLVGDRVYQVVALGPEEFAKGKEVDDYLKSFNRRVSLRPLHPAVHVERHGPSAQRGGWAEIAREAQDNATPEGLQNPGTFQSRLGNLGFSKAPFALRARGVKIAKFAYSFPSTSIHDPAAADVRERRVAAVAEHVVVVAAGVLERVGQYRHAVEGALRVDALGQRDDR
jgi:hypothetical protein